MNILFLAGGYDQIAFIDELKKREFTVLLADYNEHPLAENHADKFFQISTLDVEAIKELALKEKIDKILTACTDQALLTMAKVSEELNLPCYLTYQQALNITNKSYMKDIFAANNIPTAKYIKISDIKEIYKENLQYPLVVKPADCNSSKGVKKVTDEKSLYIAASEALNLSRSHKCVIEEFKEGKEFSADFWLFDDKAHLIGLSENIKGGSSENFTIVKSVYNPKNIANKRVSDLENIAFSVGKAFGLKNTPLLLQLIENNDDLYVLEFSARMGGGGKHDFIELMTGVDIKNIFLNMALSENYTPEFEVKFCDKKIEIYYVYVNSGKFNKLEGFETLDRYSIYKPFKTKIDKALNSGDRVASVCFIEDDKFSISDKFRIFLNNCKVLNENNEDIMKRDMWEVK